MARLFESTVVSVGEFCMVLIKPYVQYRKYHFQP